MAGIVPIPTTRVGDLFVRQRLTDQVQNDQLALFRLQNQISTGQRLQLPSEDAPAAMRAINLQRLLDRKGQIKTNLQASEQYLSAADSSLGSISSLLIKLRSDTLGATSTLATDSDRETLIQQIDQAMRTLVDTANTKSQGRYLFAGSSSQTQPYDYNGEFVQYFGNEGTLRSFVDLERLFDTNLSGPQVFGGISNSIEGSVDLNPHLTVDTLLTSINGGAGIGRNAAISVSVNNGSSTVTSVISLAGAVTMGDVARLIERGMPSGTTVTAEITNTGLDLSTPTGTISVSEVADGRTARELRILTPTGAVLSNSITGGDLNPTVLRTTKLTELVGTKAQGRISSAGANNDILLTAVNNGADFNGITVNIVNSGSVTAGNEIASYDSNTNTLTVQVQSGMSTATQVAAAISAEGTFNAVADYHDALTESQTGTGHVDAGSRTNVTTGGSGQVLDTASGLILTNGGESVTIDTSTARTVEDVINLINGSRLGLEAEVNADGTGINVRSRLSGTDFTIGENGGQLATQLGIRTYTGTTSLSALNRGLGVPTTADLEQLDTSKLDQLQIVARNGVQFNVDLTTATSLQDVADLINAHPLNFGNTEVLARLTPNGNGIELVDSSVDGSGNVTGDLRILGGTQAAEYLGFVNAGAAEKASHITNAEGDYVQAGRNVLGHDMMIESRNGTRLWIDLAGAKTVQDAIDRINNNPENTGSPRPIQARLAAVGNGIELVDSTVGAGSLTVHSIAGSDAAEFLGFVPAGQTEISSATTTLKSEDRNTMEVDSVFNTLVRLKHALHSGNLDEIGRSIDRLDQDISRVNFARAEIGARLQNLEVISVRLEDENVQLKTALSGEVDVDLVDAISQLTARQYAFEASLRMSASTMQLSLLNFL